MGRLKVSGPRLSRQQARLAAPALTEAARTRVRDKAQPWRAWYKTKRWRQLRLAVLKRDGFRCVQTGVMLVGRYPAGNSPVVDHIVPHRGDEALFWDEANLQSVSADYHNGEKQRIEARI